MCGNRLNCWNTMPMSARSRAIPRPAVSTRWPSNVIDPPSMASSPLTQRSIVDLPEPEGPATTIDSPRSMPRSMPSRTTLPSKALRTPDSSTIRSPIGGADATPAGGARRWTASEHRLPDIEAGHAGEEDRIEPVERPAVGAEQAAGVLRARVALQVALEQVADRRRGRDRRAEDQRLHAGHPLLVDAGEPHGEHARDEADEQPLDRLVRRDPRSQPAAAEHPPAHVGARVADEGADEHADDDAVAVRQLAQHHGVREPEPDPAQ